MVKILNGEIVSDDDPRLRQRSNQSNSQRNENSSNSTGFGGFNMPSKVHFPFSSVTFYWFAL